jgi:hypothetical protein
MASIQIPNLPAVTSLSGSEQMEAVQGGVSSRVTINQISAFAGSQYGLTPIASGNILGNISGVSAIPVGNTLTAYMDNAFGTTQGSIVYRDLTNWQSLGPGVLGQALTTNGPNANPQYRDFSGGGTVLQITAGTNLSASPVNPITSSGTISTIMNPAFTTSVTSPLIIGGTATSSSLTLQSTSGVGATDSILFKVGNNGAVTALTIDTTGASAFGVSATSPLLIATTSTTSPLIIATASRTSTATTGAFSYGTNGFSDTNVLASFQSSVNSYNQVTIQNTSSGAASSAEFIAYNNNGTASTNYAAFGINSSGYTGTGSLNAAGYGFFTTGSTDLVLGTIGSNAIHFVTNSSATDAITINSSGQVTVPNINITGGTVTLTSATVPIIYGGTTASSTLTLQSTSGVGTTDSVSIKVGNNGATTGLTVATTGIASFPTTGATGMVVGTTAQRPTAATGYFRFNSSLPRFEGYDGTSWTPFAITTGGGNDTIFTLNGQTVTTNYTVPATTNAMSAGPIVINSSIQVTVTTGSQWDVI